MRIVTLMIRKWFGGKYGKKYKGEPRVFEFDANNDRHQTLMNMMVAGMITIIKII